MFQLELNEFGALQQGQVCSDELKEKIWIMKEKESTVYECRDYLSRRRLGGAELHANETNVRSFDESVHQGESDVASDHEVDITCRKTMCEWCYRIVDHFGGDRELVAVAMNYLDRVLDKFHCDRKAYKLVVITSLYLAIKIINRRALPMEALAELSKGEFETHHISDMESFILTTLSWQLYPPTSSTYITCFQNIIPPTLSASVRRSILEKAYFYAELSVIEYSFITFKQSEIAFAAFLNAVSGVNSTLLPPMEKQSIIKTIEDLSGMQQDDTSIISARRKILFEYQNSDQFKLHDADINPSEDTIQTIKNIHELKGDSYDGSVSPVCISSS